MNQQSDVKIDQTLSEIQKNVGEIYKNTNPEVCGKQGQRGITLQSVRNIIEISKKKKKKNKKWTIKQAINSSRRQECANMLMRVQVNYQLICNYISYFGQNPQDVLQLAETPDNIMNKIDNLTK